MKDKIFEILEKVKEYYQIVRPRFAKVVKTYKKEIVSGAVILVTFFNSIAIVTLTKSYKACEERVTSLETEFEAYGSLLVDLSDELKSIKKVTWDLTSEFAQLREGNYQTVEKVVATGKTKSGEVRKVELTKADLFERADTFDTGLPVTRSWEADAIAKFAKRLSDKYSVPIHIIYTLIGTESSFKYDAKNPIKQSYGRGLMQVSDIAFKDYVKAHPKTTITIKDLETSIECNMEVGVWYYQHLYNDCAKKDPKLTWRDLYGAYNVGFNGYTKNRDSFLKGWDPIRNQKYNALNNWDVNYKKVINHFFC